MEKSHISKTTHIKNHITPLYISILSISKYTPKLNATQTQQIAHNGLCLRYLYDTNAAEDTIETRVIIISLSKNVCHPELLINGWTPAIQTPPESKDVQVTFASYYPPHNPLT